jgi:antitoxin (DNA-binding transcriptional repressor) of toxin-antitoxin stability system
MTTVTLADAQANLADLLRRAARGEQLVVTDGGAWLGALGQAPPPPPTAEEEAARQRVAEKAFHEMTALMRQWCAEDGVPYWPDQAPPEALKPALPAA